MMPKNKIKGRNKRRRGTTSFFTNIQLTEDATTVTLGLKSQTRSKITRRMQKRLTSWRFRPGL